MNGFATGVTEKIDFAANSSAGVEAGNSDKTAAWVAGASTGTEGGEVAEGGGPNPAGKHRCATFSSETAMLETLDQIP